MNNHLKSFSSSVKPQLSIKRFGPESANVGYWGPVTSSIDWCETNYARSQYIAEFFNSTSNVVTISIGILLCFHAQPFKLERRFTFAALGLMLVGIGSLCFHGTLLYEAQLLDEIPMLYFELVGAYIALERFKNIQYSWLPAVIWTIGTIYTILHVHYRLIVTFHIIFAILLIPMLSPLIYARSDPMTIRCIVTTVCIWSFSFLVWELDQVFCPEIERYYLHAVWHAGTALAGAVWLEGMMFYRLKYVHRRQNIMMAIKFGFIPILQLKPKVSRELKNLHIDLDDSNLHRKLSNSPSPRKDNHILNFLASPPPIVDLRKVDSNLYLRKPAK